MEAAAQMRHGYSYSDVHSDFPHEDEYFCKYIIINLHLHIWCKAVSKYQYTACPRKNVQIHGIALLINGHVSWTSGRWADGPF